MRNAQLDRIEFEGANLGIVVAGDSGMSYAAQGTPDCNVAFGHDFSARIDVTNNDEMSLVADSLSGA